MTENQILRNLAALNPVSDEPDYDEDAERGLMALLQTVRAEAPAPARARGPRGRLARLPGWGAAISIAAAVALALVVVVGGFGGRDALGGKPATLTATHIDARGLVADRMLAALTGADDYIVRGDQLQTDPSGACIDRSPRLTSTAPSTSLTWSTPPAELQPSRRPTSQSAAA